MECVRYARGFCFSDDLNTFFEVVSNIGSLTISSALQHPPVTPQDTATTPNGCPKPLPTLTILQLRRLGQKNRHSPFNLREVTREQYAALDPYRNLGD